MRWMVSVLVCLGASFACAGPSEPRVAASPEPPVAASPEPRVAVGPLDIAVDLTGGPLVYRMSFQPTEASESPPLVGWFEDETVVLELEGEVRVVRGRCGPYRGIEDEGCLPLLFPEGAAIGEEGTAIGWRWGEAGGGGLQIDGHAAAERIGPGRVVVRTQTRHRYAAAIGGASRASGEFLIEEGRYQEVRHEFDFVVFGLNPTGAAAQSEQRGRLIVRFDEHATAARRSGESP